ARYFEAQHPYAYQVAIAPGPEHPAIRWLKAKSPGLCTNSATAFALLARAAGIPARAVTGFNTQEFDPATQSYVVRAAHAHAWTEYLDEQNRCIRFDPTPPVSEATFQAH